MGNASQPDTEAARKGPDEVHHTRYAEAIQGSNAMLRALLENGALVERESGEDALEYIRRLIRNDFEQGPENCLFPDIYGKTMHATSNEHVLSNFVVLYRVDGLLPADPPLGFQCDAEDGDHAQEQCENAYPGCDVVWVWQGPKGVGVYPALQDYWGNETAEANGEQPTA